MKVSLASAKWTRGQAMRASLALCLTAGSALSSGAREVLQRHESCVLVATAQYDNCEVFNHFKCSDSAPVVYRVESLDEDRVLTVEEYNKDQGAISITSSEGEMAATLVSQTEHPRLALKTGVRTERFEGKLSVLGAAVRMSGRSEYRYEGEMVTLAETSFHRLPFDSEMMSTGKAFGTEITIAMTAQGSMIFSDQLDLWLEEVTRSKSEGEAEEVTRLTQLSLPGQDGFGATEPRFGCTGLSLNSTKAEAPA